MKQSDWSRVTAAAMGPALEYLEALHHAPVFREVEDAAEIRRAIGDVLSVDGEPAESVVSHLASSIQPYLTGFATGRFFGFVIGGLHPASYGADLLATTWDQNSGLYPITPGTAVVEEIAAEWVLDVLELPAGSSVGFVTGGQMANFTCLAAARDQVLRDSGWDVEADGLQGAPTVNVVLKEDVHSTIKAALRYLGLGHATAHLVACDDQSRIDPAALAETLSGLEGPTIVCVESANVNTGSFDLFDAVADIVEEHRRRGNPTWVHVDGAIGLWARACADLSGLGAGMERLDSWSTDAHKLLNVGYDSGIAICRHAAAHRSAMSVSASYLIQGDGENRDPMDWNPEFSRRARGLAVYATLRSLGRSGLDELVLRAHHLAVRFAEQLGADPAIEIHNEVVFNQVLVRWLEADGDHDAFNDAVMERTRNDGVAYFSGTTHHGMRMMRVSVSDWATDTDDVDAAVGALFAARAAVQSA